MFELIKAALGQTGSDFDEEIEIYINDTLSELRDTFHLTDAISESDIEDPQIKLAMIFGCKAKSNFDGEAEKWGEMYTKKVKQLQSSGNYGLRYSE